MDFLEGARLCFPGKSLLKRRENQEIRTCGYGSRSCSTLLWGLMTDGRESIVFVGNLASLGGYRENRNSDSSDSQASPAEFVSIPSTPVPASPCGLRRSTWIKSSPSRLNYNENFYPHERRIPWSQYRHLTMSLLLSEYFLQHLCATHCLFFKTIWSLKFVSSDKEPC